MNIKKGPFILIPKKYKKLEWRYATYNYTPLSDYLVSENGILYNYLTLTIRKGHDNVKDIDRHQRISINNKQYYISRIVAEAFVKNDNPDINILVRHLDDNPLNNHYSNLKWGTAHENTLDGIINGKIVYDEHRNYAKSEMHGMSTLTNEEVLNICKLLSNGVGIAIIADKFNTSFGVINHIYKGRTWREISNSFLPFPEYDTRKHKVDIELKNKIISILTNNINESPSTIINLLNLDDNNRNRCIINYIKRKMKQKLCSTTRES